MKKPKYYDWRSEYSATYRAFRNTLDRGYDREGFYFKIYIRTGKDTKDEYESVIILLNMWL